MCIATIRGKFILQSYTRIIPLLFQTACSSAIRNIVSRSKQYVKDFVELDVEALLNEVMKKHPKTEDMVKSALRDLGLKVVLKEQWKGGLIGGDKLDQ